MATKKKSLTTCITDAGNLLRDEDRADILARFNALVGEGAKSGAAAKQAVAEQIAKVQGLLGVAVDEVAAEPATIEDVGEKIGGARKDTAESGGTKAKKGTTDDRPAWARRFEVSQIVTPGGMVGEVKDAGRWIIRDSRNLDWMKQPKQVGRDTYATKEEAEAIVPIAAVGLKHRPVSTRDGKYEIWREISDRKRVKVVDRTFDTREEAMAYMLANAVQIVETNTTFGEADLPLPPDRKRTGPEKRTGNVTGADFKTTFGLRGVEFGNWNNQDERQALMNDAWDGLMDLADVLDLPPKALGLNGDLALAFGARGHGLNSARAHYEPARTVINLTKEQGAGSLAHEWFHALDHYFGRQDGKASAEWVVGADGTRTLKVSGDGAEMVSSGFRGERSGVPPALRRAYDAMLRTMTKKAETYVEDTAKADKWTGVARDELATALASLRRDLAEQKDVRYYKRNNKPASAELLAEFDAIAKQMLDGEVTALATDWRTFIKNGDKPANVRGGGAIANRWTNDTLERMSAIYKEVRGRSGFDANKQGVLDRLRSNMSRYSERLKMLADAQAGADKVRAVPTDFAMNARDLDQGRGTDYWTTPHEMAARAFQGYVEDKIAERGGVSRFLNYAPENSVILTPWGFKRPYPAGAERQAINAAFDKMLSRLEAVTDEAGNVSLVGKSDAAIASYALAQVQPAAAEVAALEAEYGAESDTAPFHARLAQDVADYINKGAEAISAAIRSIVGKVAKVVLSIAVVFNVAGLNPQFSSESYARTVAAMPKTVTVTETVQFRQAGKADFNGRELSPAASKVVNWIGAQNRQSEVSLVLDPTTGRMYVLRGGKIEADAPALFGKAGVGSNEHLVRTFGNRGQPSYSIDNMPDENKITPAGRFPLNMEDDPDYGTRITFNHSLGIAYAVHRVYLGDPKERRQQRLDSATASDNAISFGCVNVSDEFYDKTLKRFNYNGDAYAYLIPSDASQLDATIPMPAPLETTRTTTYTQGGQQADEVAGRRGEDPAMAERRRQTSRSAARRRLIDGPEPEGDAQFSRAPGVRPALDKAIAAKEAFDAYDRKAVKVDDPETYFTLAQKLSDAKKALVAKLMKQPDDGFALQGRTGTGRMVIVNASAQNPGQWQLTRFDGNDEPWGDSQYRTKESVLTDFLREIDLTTLQDLDGAFSRAPGSTTGIPLADAEAVADAIRAAYPTGPQIVVVDEVSKAPQALVDQINNADAANTVEGAYYKGKIYLFPQNVADIERLMFVGAHHEIRHAGLDALFGKRKNALMLSLFLSNPKLADAARKKMVEINTDSKVLATEEALADMPLEDMAKLNGWNKIVAAVRQWLRGMADRLRRNHPKLAAMIQPDQWTDNDVAALIRRAEDISRGGTVPARAAGAVFSRADDKFRVINEVKDAIQRWDGPEVRKVADPMERARALRELRGLLQDGEASTEDMHRIAYNWNARSYVVAPASGKFGGGPAAVAIFMAEKAAASGRPHSPVALQYGDEFAVVVDGRVVNTKPTMQEAQESAEYTDAEFWRGEIESAPDQWPQWNRGGEAMFSRAEQTNTPAFRRWFGDSKVVDAQGKPLVVYHGTNRNFTVFSAGNAQGWGTGIYLTDNAQEAAEYGVNVMPLYVSLQNPWIEGQSPSPDATGTKAWATYLKDRGASTDPDSDNFVSMDDALAEDGDLMNQVLREFGYDGIIAKLQSGQPGQEIVAFRPEQIKSANDNNGNFSPESADIRFSIRAGTAKVTAQRQVTQAVRNTVADYLGNAGAKVSWWDKTLGTQYAKAQKFPAYKRVFDQVQQYLEDTSAMANEAADQAKGILPKLETWKDLKNFGLKPADAQAIAAPIFEGTLTDQKVYDDAELAGRFKLTPAQIAQYKEFRAAVNTSLDQAMAAEALRMLGDKNAALRELALTDRGALRQGISDFLTDQAIQAGEDVTAQGEDRGKFTLLRDDIAEKYQRIDALKSQGYAPLMRFGQYKVNITDPQTGETLFFGLYESKAAANEALRDLRADPEFAKADFEQGVLSAEQYKLFSAMPLDSLEMFAEAIGAEKSEVYQDFIRLAKNNRSTMKRLLKRKGTAGFSEDVPRVLASFVTSNARMAAGALNMPSAKEAAMDIRDGDIQDEAIKLLETVQNPTDTAGAVRSLMFVNFIGGSIASAVVNLTQPLTMTLPYLSQFGGGVKAAKRLMTAGKMVASGKVDDMALRVALKRAETDGIVSPQEIHHLTAQAMGTFGTNPYLQRAAFIWAAPFSLAEQFNRRVSFIAAFNTAREQGIEDPFSFAEQAVTETQGLYNKGNAPNLARGTVGAAALTFKQFSIHYLEWMGRMYRSGPEGKKAVALALALLILAAGTDGLPFADDLDDLIDTLAQALGYDLNIKKARREFVAETLGAGDVTADILARGVTAVPGVPLDASIRMSMGNLLPGTGLFLRSNTDKSRDLLEVAGPAGGLAKQYIEAGTKALRGDFGGAVTSALPVALQNVAKAADMWTTGEARDTLGRKVMDADEVDGLMKFIGFQPQAIARESEKIQMIRRSEQLAKNVEGEIASAWARAIVDKDQDGVAEARAKLAQWNEDNPDSPIRIKMQQIIQRAKKLREDRASRFITSVSPERRRAVAEALE
jgi:hypothetical protein